MAKLRFITKTPSPTSNVINFKEHRYIRRYKLFRNLFICSIIVLIAETIYMGLHYVNR